MLCSIGRRHGKAAQIGEERNQHGVCRRFNLMGQPFKQMCAPLRQIEDAWREAFWMKGKAQYVNGWSQQRLINTGEKLRHHPICRDQIPVSIESQCWKWLMAF